MKTNFSFTLLVQMLSLVMIVASGMKLVKVLPDPAMKTSTKKSAAKKMVTKPERTAAAAVSEVNRANVALIATPKFGEADASKTKEVDDNDAEKADQRFYLHQKLGLEEHQILAVLQQTENFRMELEAISATNLNDPAQAQKLKDEASHRHSEWMRLNLGQEAYSELSAVSKR